MICGTLATGASACAEILLGTNQTDAVEQGTGAAKGTVNHFLSVDLSSFQIVDILTSERFMNSLDEPTKVRVVAAIEYSEFRSVKQFRKEFAEARMVVNELEETSEVDEAVESELTNKFGQISVGSTDATTGIRDAAPELYALCRRRFPKFDVSEKEVRRELLKRCNRRTERLDFEAFRTVCNMYEEKYGAAEGKNEARIELENRFSGAIQGRTSFDVDSAMVVLVDLHADSAEGDANEMSFTRTGDEWDDEVVEKLFQEQENANCNITKEGFIRVGLQVLFKRS